MANEDLRRKLRSEDIPFWKVAEKMGVHENTISRRLRSELSEDDKQKILSIIEELSVENQEETV